MRIAVIGTKGLPARQGGIEHHCQELYSRVVKQGHSVDIFARASYIDLASSKKPYYSNGVRVIPLPCPGWRGADAIVCSVLGAIAACIFRYDIVHFHAIGPALFSWLPKLLSPAKVVVTCHGLDWSRTKWGRLSTKLLRLGEGIAVRASDELIVVSEHLGAYFWGKYGKDTTYIPNAPATYAEPDSGFAFGRSLGLQKGNYILFVGRLVPEKRPELLIQAFQSLKPLGWQLVLVGSSSDTNRFTLQLTELTHDDPDIIFTGQLVGVQLAEVVRGAGLFVLPSDVEGLPLVILEAMHQGVPVIASNIPIHRALIGKDRGVLFETGDVESCIDALEWSINRPQRMQLFAQNARKFVRANFDWEDITSATLRLFSKPSTRMSVSRPSKMQSKTVAKVIPEKN